MAPEEKAFDLSKELLTSSRLLVHSVLFSFFSAFCTEQCTIFVSTVNYGIHIFAVDEFSFLVCARKIEIKSASAGRLFGV